MMTDMQTDWRYTQEKLEVREKALSMLLQRFGSQLNADGSPKYSSKSIYECAHDWVSQGNMICHGLVKYYEVYYAVQGNDKTDQGST